MLAIFVVSIMVALFAFAGRANAALYLEGELVQLDKEKLAGGEGVARGRYAFTRDMPSEGHAIKEIAWLSLAPGHSIGLHTHAVNEDAYIIVSGHGILTDADGKDYPVKEGDVMIARKGESHALSNSGVGDLVFVSVIAQ